uniref:Uncharacterized protein n=1 Tax=Anguilla anguilla TaxID=7936 RepID=A0A0E9RQA0_ANGAN
MFIPPPAQVKTSLRSKYIITRKAIQLWVLPAMACIVESCTDVRFQPKPG